MTEQTGSRWIMSASEAAIKEIIRLRSDAADLQQTFDLQWEADMRAVKMWREAHPGNELVLPDRANMVVWLLEQHDALAAQPASPLRGREIEDADDLEFLDLEHLDGSASPPEQPTSPLRGRGDIIGLLNLEEDRLRDVEGLRMGDVSMMFQRLYAALASPPEQPAAAPVTGMEPTDHD